MQLDPGPSSVAQGGGILNSDKGSKVLRSYGSYRPRRRPSVWDKTLKILGLFILAFFVTEVLLYQKLSGTLSQAKGLHKEVARHVRQKIRRAMVQGGEVPRMLNHFLPRPRLLRWGNLPTVEELVGEVNPPDWQTLDLRLPQRAAPKYLEEPSLELALDTKSVVPGDRVLTTPAASSSKPPQRTHPPPSMSRRDEVPDGNRKQRQDKFHSNAPDLSHSVLDALNLNSRLQPLLSREVDLVLNNLLLEMKGSISCGGHMVMEFKNFEEVEAAAPDLKSVVPENDPFTSQSMGSCAVVGNSGTLLTHTHGRDIDSHDTVIRFNAAPTRNYETYVGSKTTIRLQNVDNLGFRERASDKHLIFSARSKKDLSRFYSHRKKYSGRPQFAFNPEFWCHVWDWVAHRKLKPTSGMAGVVMALKHCRHPVDLYGFSHNATQFHYFNQLPEKVTHQEIYKYHPLVEEAEIYRELKEMNMTRIFA